MSGRYNTKNEFEASDSINNNDYAEFMKKLYDIDIDEQNKDYNSRSNTDLSEDNQGDDDAKLQEYIKILRDMSDVENRDNISSTKPKNDYRA